MHDTDIPDAPELEYEIHRSHRAYRVRQVYGPFHRGAWSEWMPGAPPEGYEPPTLRERLGFAAILAGIAVILWVALAITSW